MILAMGTKRRAVIIYRLIYCDAAWQITEFGKECMRIIIFRPIINLLYLEISAYPAQALTNTYHTAAGSSGKRLSYRR